MEELVSIVLGLGALALPVVCLVRGGKPSRYAAGSFLLWGLALLAQLAGRLACDGAFPHEIGVFLGYPLGDVVGFIANRGQNFTCCGCWKSYSDPDAARRHFAQLNKCTAIYLRLFHSGRPILRLAVAV